MRHLLLTALLIAPTAVFPAGGDSFTPPTQTQTTKTCSKGQIWDDASKSCVDSSQSSLDDDQRYQAVRELAYAGAYDRAAAVLDSFADARDDRALTYRGFLARKTGQSDAAFALYAAALERNPDNLLARSYMGQGLVAAGQRDAARLQLAEIRARGGAGTWAEEALDRALKRGSAYNY